MQWGAGAACRGLWLRGIRCRVARYQRREGGDASLSILAARSRRSSLVEKVEVLQDGVISVAFEDGHSAKYLPRWLRVNCETNIHATGQKIAVPSHFAKIGASKTKVGPCPGDKTTNLLSIEWNDGSESTFAGSWLREYDHSVSTVIEKTQSTWPDPLRAWESIPKVHAAQLMDSDDGVYRILSKVNSSGLCLVDGVGTESGTVSNLAERVAPLSHSMLYGSVFDVFTRSSPRNIAYTAEALPLHQDLAYYESPPGLQFMHCVSFDDSVQGGESIYLDGFAAAREFKKRFPEYFQVLTTLMATFQKVRQPVAATDDLLSIHASKDKDEVVRDACRSASADKAGACLIFQRPHIEVNKDGEIIGVNWSPMFEGVLGVQTADMPAYYAAYDAFQGFITDSDFAHEHTLRRRLKPGECMIFNNRRILHGREAFSGDGRRHIQGCYCNIDESLSRFLVLRAQLKDERVPVKRWGNSSIPPV